jgi:TrkA domain protein
VGVTVQPLMGIGTRYDLHGRGGTRVSVVVHKDGHRELYAFEDGAQEPTAVVTLTEEQARLLGAVISGTYVVP